VLAAMVLSALVAVPSSAGPASQPAGVHRAAMGSLPPNVMTAALGAEGRVVRQGQALAVETVRVPEDLRTAGGDVPETVWRVTIGGFFPPRALRYVVLADGHPIGYGIPGGNGSFVQAVTSDPSVMSSAITVRYGDSRQPDSAAPGVASGDGPTSAAPTSAVRGPLPVTRTEYNLGWQAFQPSDLGGKVELVADVHYPTGLPGGPYPLVLFIHGNHWSCYEHRRVTYRWPCEEGWKPLPNYIGYDYIASDLASYGYIVVSISANGVNVLGNRVDDTGMHQRGELVIKHIDLWKMWTTTGGGPFGTTFVGRVDLSRIGVMGHSRGGEGAVYSVIVDRKRPVPYGIDAVLALAPVDFTRATINDVSLAVVLPYCDGDVSDLQGVHFFDDTRYLVPGDPTMKATVTVLGANHDFFNTVWSPHNGYPGAWDDGWYGCPGRLTQKQERQVGLTYISGFFRRYLGNDVSLDPMWTGATTPPEIAPAQTLVSYLAPDIASQRMDVDRFDDPVGLGADHVGGAVTPLDMTLFGWCADTWDMRCITGRYTWYDVHLPGLGQGVLGWSSHDAVLRFDIPPGQGDVHGFDALQFRAAVNPDYWVNRELNYQDMAVALVDGSGGSVEVAASDVGNEALANPLRGIGKRHGTSNGHVILNQVRFPLVDFAGVDLTDVRAIEFRFSRTDAGVLEVADLAFSRGAV